MVKIRIIRLSKVENEVPDIQKNNIISVTPFAVGEKAWAAVTYDDEVNEDA